MTAVLYRQAWGAVGPNFTWNNLFDFTRDAAAEGYVGIEGPRNCLFHVSQGRVGEIIARLEWPTLQPGDEVRLSDLRLGGRVVENAKQDQRVARVAVVEVATFESEAEGNPLHDHVPEPGHCAEVVEDRLTESGNRGKEVRAVQRRSRRHARIVV